MEKSEIRLMSGMVAPDAEETLREKYLTFLLGEDEYCMEVRHVLEIIGMQNITPIPDVPEYIMGVINLRGKVVPLLDMRTRMGMEKKAFDARTCIIVVLHSTGNTGLVVDRVKMVVNISRDSLEIYKQSGTVLSHRFIRGMARLDDGVKVLMNLDSILGRD
ncbi:MAG: chemotaxis protein CheW [Deltaproteobacteria bacterium]|nr:chemotaxis protein CheW [Deltaproteobacteria bacterium]